MPLNTPTVTSVTETTVTLDCVAPTGLVGPFEYQYERVQGTEDFTSGPAVVTLHDGSDGSFAPPTLTFAPGAAPPAQFSIYTPASRGVKSITTTNDRGITDSTPFSFNASPLFEDPEAVPTVIYYGYQFFSDGVTPVKGREIEIRLNNPSEEPIVQGHKYLESTLRTVETDESGLWHATLVRGKQYTVICPQSSLFKTFTATSDITLFSVDIDSA